LVRAGLEALIAREAGKRLAARARTQPDLASIPRRASELVANKPKSEVSGATDKGANSMPDVSPLVPRRGSGVQGRHPPNYPDLNFHVIAPAFGVSSTFLGRVLNGRMRPSMEVAQKLAAYLGWPLERVATLYKDKQLGKNATEHKLGVSRGNRVEAGTKADGQPA